MKSALASTSHLDSMPVQQLQLTVLRRLRQQQWVLGQTRLPGELGDAVDGDMWTRLCVLPLEADLVW